jgi:hypothetical protein
VAQLERRGIPTICFANDVFRPIARATAELIGLPPSYVDERTIFLRHPTSTLSKDEMEAAVDERLDELVDKMLGGSYDGTSERDSSALAVLIEGLAADGAELVVGDVVNGVVRCRLVVHDAEKCADGTCLLPPPLMRSVVESTVRAALPGAISVLLEDQRSSS